MSGLYLTYDEPLGQSPVNYPTTGPVPGTSGLTLEIGSSYNVFGGSVVRKRELLLGLRMASVSEVVLNIPRILPYIMETDVNTMKGFRPFFRNLFQQDAAKERLTTQSPVRLIEFHISLIFQGFHR
ncbi:hypothetical protein BGX38DRAFT_1140465 [Terfezia claveryi]|nr:hypothetical protein BGX38DRAFT_1140465 [Terfezia claveryi]